MHSCTLVNGRLTSLRLPIFILVSFIILFACKEDEEVPVPVISSFTPGSGPVGTEVTINGKNFSDELNGNAVTVANVPATILRVSKVSIQIKVPEGATTGKIAVEVNGKTGISSTDFEVIAKLEGTAFSPQSGVVGSSVTITGSGFSASPANNKVTFNGVTAVVTAATAASLTVTVPAEGSSGPIMVEANTQSVTLPGDFAYLPKIDAIFPRHVPVKGIVTINGSGFSSTLTNNHVYINGTESTILEGTSHSLKVVVPTGAVTGPVTVVTDGHEGVGPQLDVVVEALAISGAKNQNGVAVIVDDQGNTYVAGSIDGATNFGSTTVDASYSQLFVAKYDADSNLKWVKTAGGSNGNGVSAIVLDREGNLVMGGTYSGEADFGSIHVAAGSGGFMAKMNPSGEFLWVTCFPRTSLHSNSVLNVCVDAENNLVAAGYYGGTITIGSQTLTSPTEESGFVTKFTPGGVPVWAKSFSSSLTTSFSSVACNDAGDVYIAGGFFGSITFGSETYITPADDLNAYLLKLNNNGDLVWSSHFSGNQWNDITDIDVDHAGDIVAFGYYASELNAGGKSVSGGGVQNIFVSKISSAGTAKWITAGKSQFASSSRLAVDGDNDIYIAGNYNADIHFEQEVYRATNMGQTLVVKLRSNGTVSWARQGSGGQSSSAVGVAVGEDKTVHVVGRYYGGETTYGFTALQYIADADSFLWKIWQE